LHFFGELISRKKIRMMVELKPINQEAVMNSFSEGGIQVDFLATTGELLSARITDPDALTLLGVRAPGRMSVSGTSDFRPPVYFSASQKLSAISGPSADRATAVLMEAWNTLQQKLGTNKPVCLLISENLNAPELVVRKMSKLAGKVPWAGVSHVWRDDLLFERSLMDRLASEQRGLGVLAICGNVQIQVDSLPGLTPMGYPGNDEDGKKQLAAERQQLLSKIDELKNRLAFPEDLPDHTIFLMQPGASFVSRIVSGELKARLGGKAEVFDFVGERPMVSVGSGATYVHGKTRTNTMVAICLNGFLPLRLDSASLLRRQPERRLVSWEVSNPISELAYSFGPNPLQELFDHMGEEGIRLLREAERVDAFRVKPNNPDDWSTPSRPNIDGHEIVSQGKTQNREFAQQLGSVILNEANSFGGDMPKGCIWSPQSAFKVWRKAEAATILVCFECDSLQIQFQDVKGKVTGTVWLDFDRNRDALLHLAQRALGSDPALKIPN
jgi:hypothetical protein